MSGSDPFNGTGGVACRRRRIMRPSPTNALAWIVTDRAGHIAVLSQSAALLLGLHTSAAGQNLLLFFPRDHRALAMDMEIALSGWPSARTVILSPTASRPVTIRYLVTRRVVHNTVTLDWTIDLVDTGYAVAS